jgi:RHS repeat-associated protein
MSHNPRFIHSSIYTSSAFPRGRQVIHDSLPCNKSQITRPLYQKKETINGITETFDYTFDEMGRLTNVTKDNQEVETYTYDNNGNRASATVNGTSISASYTLEDNLVVYGDNTYLYDEDGYLQTKTAPDGTSTYSYGTRGELLSVVTPTKTITYQHNANNQRVAKLVNGVVTEKYLWANLTTLLAIYDKDDNLVQRFEYADNRMPVAMTQGSDKYYLHYDQVGSLRAVTDASHNIVKEISYDTYGNVLTDSNEAFKVPFGFAGGLYDVDTKLTRFGYRDYDAYTGKWTAKDPIGFSGGDSNLYGYVLGDPVNFIDPTGEFGVFGGVLGGLLELGTQLWFNGGRFECVDWYDVGTMAAVGAVAPSGLAAGLKVFKSGKASKNLSQQLGRSRTNTRKNKLRNRINNHLNSIGSEILTQGAIAGGKYGTKKFLNMPQNGDCNNECQ